MSTKRGGGSNDKFYECPHCGREFTRPGWLGHQLLFCGPNAKQHNALKCSAIGLSGDHLELALPSILKSCEQVNQSRSTDKSTAWSLSTLESLPSEQRSIVCPQCSRTFKSGGGFGGLYLVRDHRQVSLVQHGTICVQCVIELPFSTMPKADVYWKHMDVKLEEFTSTCTEEMTLLRVNRHRKSYSGLIC